MREIHINASLGEYFLGACECGVSPSGLCCEPNIVAKMTLSYVGGCEVLECACVC